MSPTEPTTSVSPQAPAQQAPPPVDPNPMSGNWKADLFATAPPVAQPSQEPPPVVPVAEPEATPPDAQTDASLDPNAQPQDAPAEDAVSDEGDRELYESIANELRSLYPTTDPQVLKRLTDDKFMVKKLLAADEKKSKQISELLKRVTKKTPQPQRVVTDFERSLTDPPQEATPAAMPAAPESKPAEQPQQPQTQDLPAYLQWKSPLDVLTAEEQAWGDYANPDATPQQRIEAAERLDNIRDRRMWMTIQRALGNIDIDAVVEAKARQLMQTEFGDVLPAVRQSAAERAAHEAHEFAVAELTRAGVEGVGDLVKPIGDDPLVVEGQSYDRTPYNLVVQAVPGVLNIRVTHDAQGKPYPPKVAERLTRIERYRTVAGLWPAIQAQLGMGQPAPQQNATPSIDVAKQAFEAGLQSQQRSDAERARQQLNAGGGATGLAGRPAERSLSDIHRDSGAIDFNALFKG